MTTTFEEHKALCHEAGVHNKAAIRRTWQKAQSDEIWINDLYQVAIDRTPPQDGRFPKLFHLSIKRLDREPIHDFRDLQEIKNLLVGPNHEAVELYPSEERLVDTANQYHLWVLAQPGLRFPFGFQERAVTDMKVGKAKQRSFE